jgi:hypothetical protein
MELLESHHYDYLLDASLEFLHKESEEWLNTVSFWRDEMAFYYILIARNIPKEIPVKSKELKAGIEDEITKIDTGELDYIQNSIEQHEWFLGRLLDSENIDEHLYRERHEELLLQIQKFENRIKRLKKDIFSLERSLVIN